MVKTDEMKTFVELVVQMRRLQKEFFKTRNFNVMQASKRFEKDVDDRADKLLKSLSEQERHEEPSLFGEQM